MRTLKYFVLIVLLVRAAIGTEPEEKPQDLQQRLEQLLKNASSYLEEDEKKRQEAKAELIKIGKPAVPYLVSQLNTDNVMTRISLVHVLTEIGEDAVEELHSALETEDKLKKHRVIHILAKIGSPKSLEIFIQAAQNPDWQMRSSAAEGLGKIKGEDAQKILLELLDDPDKDVRLKAVIAMDELNDFDLIENLIRALDDKNYAVRFAASEVIGGFGAKAIPHLDEKINSADKKITKLLCIKTLGIIDDQNSIELLEKLFENEDWLIRYHAINAYSEIADSEKIPLLQKLSEDEKNQNVKDAIREGINKIRKRSKQKEEK